MTTTAQAGPGTATNLLFGPGTNAAEALARQILAAPTGLDRALERLPGSTELMDLIRHQVSVAQEPSVAVLADGRQVASHLDLPGVLRVSPGIALLPAGDYAAGGTPDQPAARRYSERMS